MVRESRIIAELLLRDITPEQWEELICVENVLQKRTPSSAKRNARAIRKRLQLLDPVFWKALRDGDDELATQVAFCSALERNLLLIEFLETVVRDAYLSRNETLEPYLWLDFLEDRANRDPDIHDWKESTKKKMGQVAFRMLAEVGYVKDTKTLELQHVVIRPELRVLLDDHYRHRLVTCMEVSARR